MHWFYLFVIYFAERIINVDFFLDAILRCRLVLFGDFLISGSSESLAMYISTYIIEANYYNAKRDK